MNDVLSQALKENRSLTTEERIALREQYKKERIRRVNIEVDKRTILSKEDMLNLPRHKVHCAWFVECPIDYKCRAYDPQYVRCQNCILAKEDLVCIKRDIHNEKIFSKMLTREVIDLDNKE